jgi:glycyl-tRNA synthetase alpha chain
MALTNVEFSFQAIVSKLNVFWQEQGCLIIHPYDMEKGAGTHSPYTLLRALGPEPWAVAHVEPCRRPIDSRYGKDKTDRYQWYYQYQVLIKPALENPKELFLKSLAALGVTEDGYKIEFIVDQCESPSIGAKFRGWEVWVNGAEIAQVSYLDQSCGIDCDPKPLEIAYGLERLILKIQKVESFDQIQWHNNISYGELYQNAEFEQSVYNFEKSSPEILKKLLDLYIEEVETQLKNELVYPSMDYLLKGAHTLNLLEARKAISKDTVRELSNKIRALSTQLGLLHIKKRELLGFPLLRN